ncbi:MAG: hypothetical protein A2007_02095 [Verrucomicrobia bacterium GWC2_42_7]|nr:MAG: hypothetical protein A2007_02095 [Verrucomicrobia bacterium GWC2_42_7]
MVKRELRKSQAIVEYKGDLSSVAVKLIQEKLSAFYSRTIIVVPKENPELLAGIRISIGDDVWDSSIQGRLMNFQQRLSI